METQLQTQNTEQPQKIDEWRVLNDVVYDLLDLEDKITKVVFELRAKQFVPFMIPALRKFTGYPFTEEDVANTVREIKKELDDVYNVVHEMRERHANKKLLGIFPI